MEQVLAAAYGDQYLLTISQLEQAREGLDQAAPLDAPVALLKQQLGNQGFAVLHAIFAGRQLNAVWLFLVYLLMFFVPRTVILLALAGLADTWIDFRRRLTA